jgi:predicted porin
MGTAMGSGYGASGVNRLGTVAPGVVSGLNSGTSRIIRHERSLQYITPTINGFSAMVTYAAQNDNSTAVNGNQDGYQDISLRYSNGPLNVAFSNAVIKQGNGSVASLSSIPYAGSITAATTATGTGTPAAATYTTAITSGKATSLTGLVNGEYSHSVLAANYNMGATTIYGGYTTSKSNGSATTEDANSYNVAVKHSKGAMDFLGNYMVLTSNVAGNNSAKLYGGGVDYNLSKRTAVYYRFELADTNTDGKAATAGGSVTNANMVGVRHAF